MKIRAAFLSALARFRFGCCARKRRGSSPAFAMPILLLAASAHAATINVNSTLDTLVAGDGNCTLREAINNANLDAETTAGDCAAGSGHDVVDVPAGTYVMSIVGAGEDANATGDFDISGDMDLQGAGVGSTIVDGNGLDRVFHWGSNGTFSDITVRGGLADIGAGITTGNSATHTLEDCEITDNHATLAGGGLASFAGTLVVERTTVRNNTTDDSGGGVWNRFGTGTTQITESTISFNAASRGGGVFNGTGNNAVTIDGSIISNNVADTSGGGVFNSGKLTITGSTIENNSAITSGAAIYNESPSGGASVNVTDSSVTSNTAGGNGGAIANTSGSVSATRTSFTANSAASGNGGALWNSHGAAGAVSSIYECTFTLNAAIKGGAIFNDTDGPVLSLVRVYDTSIDSNTSSDDGGGVWNDSSLQLYESVVSNNQSNTVAGSGGGGVANSSNGSAYLFNITASGNQAFGAATFGGGIGNLGILELEFGTVVGNAAVSPAGGIANGGAGTLTLRSSILANNVGNCGCLPACTDLGSNFDDDGSCLGSANMSAVDDIDLDHDLLDNGGPTLTHALPASSVAIDAYAACGVGRIDQRGAIRPAAACDSGAYEYFSVPCGNGVAEANAGEQCDDGGTSNGDCCSASCQFEIGPGTPPCCASGICQVGQGCGAVCFTANGTCTQPGGPGTACNCSP